MSSWTHIKTSFAKRVFCGRLENVNQIIEPKLFLNQCAQQLVQKVGEFIFNFKSPVKLNCELACEYIVKKGERVLYANIYHQSKMAPITLSDDFVLWFLDNVQGPILTRMDEFQLRDSGKALHKILYLQVNISKFDATNSGGSSYIDLPACIKNKKAVVNVKNYDDEKCFVWSILAALYNIPQNSERINKYPRNHEDIFNLSNIQFPTPLSNIPLFEKQNNISINVYGLEYNLKLNTYFVVGPLHYTKCKKKQHVNLLYFKQEEKTHYAWIKSLSRLLRVQLSQHNEKKYICDRCLQYFSSENMLKRHIEDCEFVDAVKIEFPNENEKWLKFKNFMRGERHPFVIYADFECLTVPISTCQPDPASSYTTAYQHHVPLAVGYLFVCSYDESLSFYESFRGPEAATWFTERMKQIVEIVQTFYKNTVPITMTSEDWFHYNTTNKCHICQKTFTNDANDNNRKVKDHCHLSGRYRGPAHMSCNLNYKLPNYIPIFFHNMSGYDSHLLVNELGATEEKIDLLPSTEEKYISFSMQVGNMKLRFLDSYRFMPSSLDELASNLRSEDFTILNKYFNTKIERDLLTKKGVFPYDYLSCWERLEEEQLPPQCEFFSKLKNKHITPDEYNHAQMVWNTFKHETLGEYMELYLQTDVLLLADIFENFRNVCIKSYNLDPAHYYTTPGLAWDAMLKITNIKLELLTDIDMLLFFERGIRGGISQCCNRYARANNRYLPSYNPEENETFLMYFDACNLYGYAMTQCLPHSNFTWLTNEEINGLDIMTISDNDAIGFIFEVDLNIPKNLHDKFRDFCPCPEHRAPPGSKFKKLMTTLYNKRKYVIHYRNLKQALELGLELVKIHRVLKFEQSFWLKKYIDLNTEFRKCATTDFEKNFFKLMNNAVFGKSMENIRNRRDIKLVSKWDGQSGARKLIAKPNFKKIILFQENLVSIELMKTKIKFDKPVYVGMAILDISKHLMYDFHYNYIHKTFTFPKLLYMDTDSLIYEFTNEDPYIKIKQNIHRFDTSNYKLNNKYEIPQANKKIVGLFKDENAGVLMTEFVGLRAKMYSFTLENEESYSKAKGVSSTVTKNLTINNYKETLFNNLKLYKTQQNIISKHHNIFTIEQNKLTLSADDDKRYVQNTTTDTLPWGHSKAFEAEKELF